MRRNVKKAALIVAACCAAMLGAIGVFFAGQAAKAQAQPPLILARQGYFYAGGHYDKAHPEEHIIGQMYVQYQIPQNQTHPFPIVMIHGGGVTGASWFATPDGREGWAQFFLRRGYAVYVVDQVARGRSFFHPDAYGEMSSQSREYVMQKFTSQERYKLWPQAAKHTQFMGKAEPGDPVFDQYWAADTPGMDNRVAQQEMNIAALVDLLDRVGPSIVMVHSQSGQYIWSITQARPNLVKAIVSAEPAGPPVHDVVVKSAQRFDQPWEKTLKQTDDDYYRDNPGVKAYGLQQTPLSYTPAVTPQSPLQFVQQDKPDRRDLSRCWLQKEPARKLNNIAGRPIMLLEAEASFYAGYNHCNVGYLRQAGVAVDFIKLADLGIHGNGHMMMLERNSDQVAGVILDWLKKHVTPLETGQVAKNYTGVVPTEGKGPLALAREGNFYAGGHYDTHEQQHIVGQMYVEYEIPAHQTHPYPVLIVHGGGQSGAGWWSTAEGREGWAPYFLRHGYAVYVADQVGRGRSPYTPEVYGPMDSQSLPYLIEKFTTQEKFKEWPQAALHTQWPGKGEAGDPIFDQYWASDAPAMTARVPESTMNVDALVSLVDRVGPVILLVHSQSGALGWPLAQRRPDLIKAIIAAEPSGPPVHQILVRSSDQRFGVDWDAGWKQNDEDYFRDIPRQKEFGLGDVPLVYNPAVSKDSPLQFVQEPKAQKPEFARCWRQKEPARKLAFLGQRPIMLLGAEASFYAGYNHCNVQYLEQAGVKIDYIQLAERGIHGNGHMMMFEKNSDQVAQVMLDWLDKTVTPTERGSAR